MQVADRKNDIIAVMDMDHDERGFFSKMFSKKSNYPDHFRGVITKISNNTKYDKDSRRYKLVDKEKSVICQVEGEFSSFIKFGNDIYWEYTKYQCPPIRRMKFTLPSDSTFREDIIYQKLKDEDSAQKAKVLLEEIQRSDKKLRENRNK